MELAQSHKRKRTYTSHTHTTGIGRKLPGMEFLDDYENTSQISVRKLNALKGPFKERIYQLGVETMNLRQKMMDVQKERDQLQEKVNLLVEERRQASKRNLEEHGDERANEEQFLDVFIEDLRNELETERNLRRKAEEEVSNLKEINESFNKELTANSVWKEAEIMMKWKTERDRRLRLDYEMEVNREQLEEYKRKLDDAKAQLNIRNPNELIKIDGIGINILTATFGLSGRQMAKMGTMIGEMFGMPIFVSIKTAKKAKVMQDPFKLLAIVKKEISALQEEQKKLEVIAEQYKKEKEVEQREAAARDAFAVNVDFDDDISASSSSEMAQVKKEEMIDSKEEMTESQPKRRRRTVVEHPIQVNVKEEVTESHPKRPREAAVEHPIQVKQEVKEEESWIDFG